jgi:hypothetical protein
VLSLQMAYYSPLFPNPITCAYDIIKQCGIELTKRLPTNGIYPWFQETWDTHCASFSFGLTEIFHITTIVVALTLFRQFLTYIIFKPLALYFRVGEHDANKFPESAWKFLIYIIMWIWSSCILYFDEEQYFYHLDTHWNFDRLLPVSIYWLYMLQMSFYIQCVIQIEVIRRDLALTLVHHSLAIILLVYSYGVKYYIIGFVLIFNFGFGDFTLQLTKSLHYFKKTKDGVERPLPTIASDVFFVLFALQWALCRLYWFLTKILYSSMYVSVKLHPNGSFYLSFNGMLILLYSMQVYWFVFIMKLLVMKVINKDGRKIGDIREADSAKEADSLIAKNMKKKN